MQPPTAARGFRKSVSKKWLTFGFEAIHRTSVSIDVLGVKLSARRTTPRLPKTHHPASR